MEQQEIQRLETLAPQHPDLQALWDEHTLYKKQLDKLESKINHMPREEEEMKLLKKQKLDAKTKLLIMLDNLS